ncbi:hypothetical protein NPIL_688411 [Nephila pilipes]|uniref:Uncharacterized protein n=1 Tax=Nephila pilipes TaxID=299642 RepID=A0A8X6IB22_NEPPI|nr:hypothetical protein NPIL_688411 [Nephila pilipes]
MQFRTKCPKLGFAQFTRKSVENHWVGANFGAKGVERGIKKCVPTQGERRRGMPMSHRGEREPNERTVKHGMLNRRRSGEGYDKKKGILRNEGKVKEKQEEVETRREMGGKKKTIAQQAMG